MNETLETNWSESISGGFSAFGTPVEPREAAERPPYRRLPPSRPLVNDAPPKDAASTNFYPLYCREVDLLFSIYRHFGIFVVS